MAKFITTHVTTCMTRQAIEGLTREIISSGNDQVQCIHAWGDTVSGRLMMEWEASDQETLIAYLEARNIRFRGNEEWIAKIQIEESVS